MLLDCEFGFAPVVEVAEGDGDADFHVGAASLAALLAEVPGAAEEAREEVEGVVAALLAAALLVLFYAVVAVLVVDFSLGVVAEDFVRFGDFYELLVGGVVSTEAC